MHGERRSERTDRIKLTPRQKQVMSQVIQGHSNKVIADKLALAEPTVKMHLTAIYDKLNVHNRTAAIAKLDELRVS